MVIRLESVFVVVVLLALLLLMPRPNEARVPVPIGGALSRVESLKGAAVYVDLGANGTALVQVVDLRMHRDAEGNAYVTRLEGTHLGGGGGVRGLRIDDTGRAEELGWRPVARLDGLAFSGSRGTYEFSELRFRKLLHEGVVLLAVASIEGIERRTGRVISEAYRSEMSICPALPVIGCAGASCGSGHCQVVEQGGWVVGCRCANGGDCFWTVTGTACWEAGCEGACRGVPPWSAGCRCN